MQKVMVFIDFENFNIALMKYYQKAYNEYAPRIDYEAFPQKLIELLPGEQNRLIKTFLFAPKPDEFLMQNKSRQAAYEWINGLKNKKYFTVIEGRHVARPVSGFKYQEMDIDKPNTYYVEEKGTDVNLAAHIITKGFLNAYDTAIIMSEDGDYIQVLDILNTIGKTTICVGVVGQKMEKLRPHSDDLIILDRTFFDCCIRPPKKLI